MHQIVRMCMLCQLRHTLVFLLKLFPNICETRVDFTASKSASLRGDLQLASFHSKMSQR